MRERFSFDARKRLRKVVMAPLFLVFWWVYLFKEYCQPDMGDLVAVPASWGFSVGGTWFLFSIIVVWMNMLPLWADVLSGLLYLLVGLIIGVKEEWYW